MNETDRIASLRDYALLDTAPEAQFDAIVAEAAATLDAPIAMISLVDEHRQWFKSRLGIADGETPISESICARAIASGEPTFVVDDASRDARFRDQNNVTGGIGIRFYAGAALRMRNGAKLGTLCVIDVEPRAGLDPAERLALEALARRTVAAIELRRDMAAGATDRDGMDAAATRELWLDQASRLLGQASIALFHAGEEGMRAHLEHVIATVDERRAEAAEAVVPGPPAALAA